MDTEKRKDIRFAVNCLADISRCDSDQIGHAAVADISIGGVAFLTPIEFSAGDKIDFCLEKDNLHIRGIIKRIKQKGLLFFYGVEFKGITTDIKLKLQEKSIYAKGVILGKHFKINFVQ